MQYKPHTYQQQATRFILEHPRAAIFLGMGLGKTIITLTALNQLLYNTYQINRVLIIAPKRVAQHTWPQEIKKWQHLQHLRYRILAAAKPAREKALQDLNQAEIFIINVENLAWLCKHLQQTKTSWPFDCVVIDELSLFKSPSSARTKALLRLHQAATHIIGLTGTPAPNSLIDLWAPFRIIDGGQRLGTHVTHYRAKYFYPAVQNGHVVYKWGLKKGADELIYDAISDITLSMKTRDYLTLPPVTRVYTQVVLDGKSRKIYQQLCKDLVVELEAAGKAVDASNAAVLSQRLQQLASGAVYTDPETKAYTEVHTAKLDALEDLLLSANGEPLLVAYWFSHEKTRILARFADAREIKTPQDIADWNAGKIPLALIHPAAAGHGLNLQAGGHLLVWFSLPWSLELYEQTCARLDRQGQTQPVTITHLIAAGTVEERVQQVLQEKSVTQQALIDAVKGELKK